MRVVVGVPTRDEGANVREVAAKLRTGLGSLGPDIEGLLVNADNSSCDATVAEFLAGAKGSRVHCLQTARDAGKGANVRAILEFASTKEADAVLLFDADVTSLRPDWVPLLLGGLRHPLSMALPVYQRHRYEANTTNQLVVPMLAALGVHLQQPIGGDFGFSGALVQALVAGPIPAQSSDHYGIDVHLTMASASHDARLVEVALGRKLHSPAFHKLLFMSQQVLDTMFREIPRLRNARRESPQDRLPRATTVTQSERPDQHAVGKGRQVVGAYLAANWAAITEILPSAAGQPRKGALLRIPRDEWAEILAEAFLAVSCGSGAQVRDALVALYFCRVLTYWSEIASLSDALVDRELEVLRAEVAAAVREHEWPTGFDGSMSPIGYRFPALD
jgi:hypothetical protein